MKKIVLSLVAMLAVSIQAQAQEVKTEIEIVDTVKKVVMTIEADRFQDLKNFDWRGNLTKSFKDVPDDAVVGIRINVQDKQLTSDSTTLPNVISLYAQDYAKNREALLTKAAKMVASFVDDDQQGNN